MIPMAHHGGEAPLILSAVIGGGLSGSLLVLRAGVAQLARRWRRGRP